ncbi:hypothetical protein ACFWN1_26465 [Streptomyces sp. NPDC058459]|uniref:hypothetical protein n=1 Tax=Streptomyces sp. NPDC058459 TaxID=3346508 RepID=UPI00364E03AD
MRPATNRARTPPRSGVRTARALVTRASAGMRATSTQVPPIIVRSTTPGGRPLRA